MLTAMAYEITGAVLSWMLGLTLLTVLTALCVRKLRAYLTERRRSKYERFSVTLLPKRASCCGGALEFSVPREYRLLKRQNGNAIFVGSGNVRLTVMQLPVTEKIRIRSLTGSELRRDPDAQHPGGDIQLPRTFSRSDGVVAGGAGRHACLHASHTGARICVPDAVYGTVDGAAARCGADPLFRHGTARPHPRGEMNLCAPDAQPSVRGIFIRNNAPAARLFLCFSHCIFLPSVL